MREPGIGFSLPVYALLAGVLVWPMAYVFYLSFYSFHLLTGQMSFVALHNYAAVVKDATFLSAIRNTCLYTSASVTLELLLGVGMALLLHRPGRFMAIVRGAVIAPWALSPVVAGLVWRMLFHSNYGILNYLLSLLGVPMGQLQWLSTPGLAMVAVITTEVWQNAPFVYVIVYAGLQSLPAEPEEAAAVDGASPWQIFRFITLPQLVPAIGVAGSFRTILALREFTIPWTVTGGGPANATLMLSIYLYRQMLQFFELGRAAAVGWIMLLLTAVLAAAFVARASRPPESALTQ
jgi:multiple sugar transport system permease protein